jgi:hypothetical protein
VLASNHGDHNYAKELISQIETDELKLNLTVTQLINDLETFLFFNKK